MGVALECSTLAAVQTSNTVNVTQGKRGLVFDQFVTIPVCSLSFHQELIETVSEYNTFAPDFPHKQVSLNLLSLPVALAID